MISHSPKCDVWASPNISIWILACSLENLFSSINEIVSTSKLPFYNPLVMKYYNVLAFFSLDYENCPLLNSVGRLFCTYTVSIQYT